MEQIRQQKPTATAVELRALAPIQQLVADLVADMLVNGSHRKIIDQLLTAAIRHQFWRRWPEDVEEQFPDLFNKPPVLLNDWRDDLHAVWRETRKAPATEKPAPSTAADRIRFSIIETLRGQFDDFLTEGTPEEWWTMWDMLVTHHSTNLGSDNANEFPLAGAFEAALGEIRHIWIKVPESLRKRVLTYVECLEEAQIDDEEEAA